MTLVFFEYDPPSEDADEITRIKNTFGDTSWLDDICQSISGISNCCAAAVTPLPPDEVRKRAPANRHRVAVGAEEVWKVFPEHRPNSVATIERFTLDGTARGDVRLSDAVVGDKLASPKLKLYSQHLSEDLSFTSHLQFDEFDVNLGDLNPFEYLALDEVCAPTTVENKWLFFCEYFSVLNGLGLELIPGVRFFSPQNLRKNTDFDDLLRVSVGHAGYFGLSRDFKSLLPKQFKGVLVVDHEKQEYAEVLVRRILAAAAFAGTAYGKVLGIAKLGRSHRNISQVVEFGTRPYCDPSLPDKYIINANDSLFRELLFLIQKGKPETLASGKEDYRLLALDVAEDARRSSVPTLVYAQLWMAIEKLLAIRNETAVQIALALTAFCLANERTAIFDKLKKGYRLRSDIVHGYSFKADDFNLCPRDAVARFFRLLFLASLNFTSSEQLFVALRNHVLSGAPNRFVS